MASAPLTRRLLFIDNRLSPCMLHVTIATVSATSPKDRRGDDSEVRFLGEEWQHILEAPPSAGMIVVTAQAGGRCAKHCYGQGLREARQQHGKSELLDEIVAAKPERDHTHNHSPEELKQQG